MPFLTSISGFSVVSTGATAQSSFLADQQSGGGSGGFNVNTDGFFQVAHTIDNPNATGTGVDDFFGAKVATCESFTVASAYREDDTSSTTSNAGKVYVFSNADGSLLATLDNPNSYNTTANDQFGRQGVAISEDYVVVSGMDEDGPSGASVGVVYVFQTSDWSLARTFTNPDGNNIQYGYDIGLSGNLVAVSARTGNKVFVFDITQSTSGGLVYTLSNPNANTADSNDYFGASLGITSDWIVVGAPNEDVSGTNAGAIYVYDTATGNLQRRIDNPNLVDPDGDAFGYYLRVSGNNMVVGVPDIGNSTGANRGVAYLMDVSDGSLTHTIVGSDYPYDPLGSYFGYGIAISNNYFIVGDPWAENYSYGYAYMFDVTSGEIVQRFTHPGTPSASFPDYGHALGLFNDRFVISEYGEVVDGENRSGRIWIYGSGGTEDNLIEPASRTQGSPLSFYGPRGIIAGGTKAGGANSNQIQYFDMSTPSNATNFGVLVTGFQSAGLSDGTRACYGYNGNIEYIETATPADATSFGTLGDDHGLWGTATCDGTKGLFIAGYNITGSGWVATTTVSQITVQTLGNSTSFGNLTSARRDLGSVSDASYAYSMGGYDSTNTVQDSIERISYASGGTASTWATLAAAVPKPSAGSNDTHIVMFENTVNTRTGNMATIEIANAGTAEFFGSLNYQRKNAVATCNGSRICVAGGSGATSSDPGYSSTYTSTIEYAEINTLYTVTDFGDLTIAQAPSSGVSGAAT